MTAADVTENIPAPLTRPHFVGVGGAGMSGIAKILARRGARVAGSDARESATAAALRELGITVHIGHDAAHLAPDATAVVVSSAIRADNPEVAEATGRGLPVVHRSDALAALMGSRRALAVAGTHGKTTTTSMLAVALGALDLDPSYAIGGDLAGPGSNAHHGSGEIFVAEADESDRSFHKYAPEVAVVLNVELDHHANYASLEEIHESFETFAGRITDGGTLVVSADQEGAREFTRRVRAAGERALTVRTYGEAADADVRVLKITQSGLTSEVTVVLDGRELTFGVSVPGRHYALNAVAALTAGAALGVPANRLAEALGTYTGVKRRLQLTGEEAGVQVIDSYAHHPTEMTADLEAVRGGASGRVLVLFQPHLFSRTQELGKEMGEALALADGSVVLPIYPAREDPVPGVTSALITDAARAAGAAVNAAGSAEEAVQAVAGMAGPGDLVLTMGAGDVTELGPRILAALAG
ncbi:UDP-N-acetylmuramate--L-alanine ligase [Streptomyces sp. NRRL S-1868]|uniref:UDP-N-acetylmuramate--L-alanine ligase n=1 Tax=Streptomyces sp. NRRL S-1868 TaxID=1463892 RepID=UPI0004CC16F6|nr:UDP-N-acetylmuramate--L-alanine ligase [Streptomyces sp. NRRL S-1868]